MASEEIDTQKNVEKHFHESSNDWVSIYSKQDHISKNIQDRKDIVLEYVDGLKLKENSKVLDIGCGTGITALDLLKRGFEVHGVDVAENMIARSNENCNEYVKKGKASFKIANIEDTDMESDQYDLVIAMGLIEYMDWERWALQEIHRILKPNGHLIITTPNRIGLSHLTNPRVFIRNTKSSLKKMSVSLIKKTLGKDKYRKVKQNKERKTNNGTSIIRYQRKKFSLEDMYSMAKEVDFTHLKSISHGYGPFWKLIKFNSLSITLDRFLSKTSNIFPFLKKMGVNNVFLFKKNGTPEDYKNRFVFKNDSQMVKDFVNEREIFIKHKKKWESINNKQLETNTPLEFEEKDIAGKNILVLSPHPDDEIIGCGGLLIKLIEKGAKVYLLHLTDGRHSSSYPKDNNDLFDARLKEAQLVKTALKAEDLIWWGYEDSTLNPNSETVSKMTDLLSQIDPDIILTPFINDIHVDHQATNQILKEALKENKSSKPIEILCYEVWSMVSVNTYCDIESVIDKKHELMRLYKTQLRGQNFILINELSAAYHAQSLFNKKGFVEVFHKLSVNDFCNLKPLSNV